MKLAGDQLVLDTNILVHWLRGKDAGAKLRTDYALGARSPRPIVPVVVKAEIKSLALQFKWGTEKQGALDELREQETAQDGPPRDRFRSVRRRRASTRREAGPARRSGGTSRRGAP